MARVTQCYAKLNSRQRGTSDSNKALWQVTATQGATIFIKKLINRYMIKNIISVFFSTIILLSCRDKGSSDTAAINDSIVQLDNNISDSSIYVVDTLNFNKVNYYVINKIDNTQLLFKVCKDKNFRDNIYSDTISVEILTGISLADFNNDSIKDVLISSVGNRPCNYIYLINEDRIIKLENEYCFTELTKLKNNYYYTYENIGCASTIWGSTLYVFDKSSFQKLGRLIVDNCEQKRITIESFKNGSITTKKYSVEEEEKISDLNAFWDSSFNYEK
jgi:hypothetical protein